MCYLLRKNSRSAGFLAQTGRKINNYRKYKKKVIRVWTTGGI